MALPESSISCYQGIPLPIVEELPPPNQYRQQLFDSIESDDRPGKVWGEKITDDTEFDPWKLVNYF